MAADDPSHYQRTAHPISHANGAYKSARSQTLDSQRQAYGEDHAYLMTDQSNDLQRKRSHTTANGSDPENAMDPYRTEGKAGSKGTHHTQPSKGKKKKKAGPAGLDEVEKDDRYWIHRDKLKEIENRELIEAGFPVGRASRSNSRSHSSQRQRDRKNSEATNHSQTADERPDHRRFSPIPAEAEEGPEENNFQWDLRTPEEIAAEREAWSARSPHVIRPSTSRIPVAKTSPVPLPSTFVERDAPLPRSRKGSANWTGEAIAVNGARVRSGSISSQVLLDDEKFATPGTTPLQSPITGSPKKAKTPAKATPTPGGRKTSAQRSTSQSKRNTSATSNKRPGTSGGSISRPTTSHRPEGEAPWIATMYKPDPRLPPDQQIIPTHAKRLQQEQWENDGKSGTIYDRDFRLLNAEEIKDKRTSSSSAQMQPLDLEKMQDNQEWPLPSPTKAELKPEPERIDTSMKSPTNEGGNYKLTPTIPQSPRSRAPSRTDARSNPGTSPKRGVETTRVPEVPAGGEKKEKKGCCCIVM